MEIQLYKTKEIIIVKEVKFIATSFEYEVFYNDTLAEAKGNLIDANGVRQPFDITLWDGQDYIDAGQWTDEDVKNRLNELL